VYGKPISFVFTYTAGIPRFDATTGATKRAPGRPPSLTEAEIVSAAVRLTREVGFENLSMRALARELGTPSMTIYHYVPSKEALEELVINAILRTIPVPGPKEGTWEDRLRKLERKVRRVLAQHPGVARHLGDGGFTESNRLAEGVMGMLRDGGFNQEDSVLCFAALYTFMTGQINLDAIADTLATSFPGTSLDGVTRSARFSRDELFEFGFDAVIQGLKAKLLDT
jgi:TetR/AcrR family transcriptional regulator, tetracycline repressor protein